MSKTIVINKCVKCAHFRPLSEGWDTGRCGLEAEHRRNFSPEIPDWCPLPDVPEAPALLVCAEKAEAEVERLRKMLSDFNERKFAVLCMYGAKEGSRERVRDEFLNWVTSIQREAK